MEGYDGAQFVGIDLHRRRTVLVRTTDTGEPLEQVRISNDADRLVEVVARAGEHPEVVLEATYGWYWAADALQAAGARVDLAPPRPGGLQGVARPVPPVGRLQHHLRVLPGPGHHRDQPVGVVADPHLLQRLTGVRGPDQHRAPPMQIDTHELGTVVTFHQGPPSS